MLVSCEVTEPSLKKPVFFFLSYHDRGQSYELNDRPSTPFRWYTTRPQKLRYDTCSTHH